MLEVVRRFTAAGWTPTEIGEALARTGDGGEDELAVVEEIVARRGE